MNTTKSDTNDSARAERVQDIRDTVSDLAELLESATLDGMDDWVLRDTRHVLNSVYARVETYVWENEKSVWNDIMCS